MTVALVVSIIAALVACGAAVAAFLVLRHTREAATTLDVEIEKGKARFDAVVAEEADRGAEELEHTLALARSQAASALADEERRIVEERRRDVAERERDATAKLGASLAEAQRAVEQRFADWGSEVAGLQQGLTGELQKAESRTAPAAADRRGRGQDRRRVRPPREHARRAPGQGRMEGP